MANQFITRYDDAVDRYLRNLHYTGASGTTINNYQTRLALFRAFWLEVNGGEPQIDPTPLDIEAWRDYLADTGKKPSTIKQYLSELRYFFNAMSDNELGEAKIYETNPVYRRLVPKVEHRPYDMLIPDEKVMLLYDNSAIPAGFKRFWARNYAIVTLLLTTSIRNGELLALTPADIDWQYHEIVIERGKGNKFRVVDLPELAETALKLYLASGIRPDCLEDDEPLFGTTAEHKFGGKRQGEKWHKGTSQWLSSLVERHIKAVTGISNIRTHDLRHIGARLDLNTGMRAEALQAKLGHANLSTTQIYSDKLQARRGRLSAAAVYAERDRQAKINMAQLLHKNLSAMATNGIIN